MPSLNDYAVLLAVVDHGSLTAAARSLQRSLQAVSRALASLERSHTRLGSRRCRLDGNGGQQG